MASSESETHLIERALALFRRLVQDDPAQTHAQSAARAEFFGVAGSGSPDPEAENRFLEWYLFEHDSDALGGRPGRELLESWVEEAEVDLLPLADKLLDSRAGVYEVTGVADEGIWLADLGGAGEYPLAEPAAAGSLAEGDLVVGRLYPVGDGVFRASPSAACIREPQLAEALRSDLERARAGRRVARLSQALLEQTFFQRRAPEAEASPEETIQETERWLVGAGLPASRVESVLEVLRAEPFDRQRLAAGGDDALGRVLDVLAFETELDLGEARGRLLAAWSALWSQDEDGASTAVAEPEESTVETGDVAGALARFDRERAAGGDLEALFDRLERDLGFDPEDGDDDAPAPDFPGVVGAMVEEFLWDDSRQGGHASEAASALRGLGDYGQHIGVLDDLTERDLVVFSTCFLLERGGLQTREDADEALVGLRNFCQWADENHALTLWSAFEPTHASLSESLPRLVVANRHLMGDAPDASGRVVAYEVVDADGELAVKRGAETATIDAAAAVRENLRPGDVVRVAGARGELELVGCYPAEAGAILGAR